MAVFLLSLCNILFNFAIGLFVAKFLGPEEYGRFALGYATAMFVQTGFFDWIRLGATRFYSERIRTAEPALRATLDVGFAAVTAALAAGASLLFLSGANFALSWPLIALAIGVAAANALFDYYAALVRACFDDRLLARLLLVKNVLAFTLMAGGAFALGTAALTLAGGIISLGGSALTARAALRDPASKLSLAPLASRSVLAIFEGFSQTGQFSLAFDFGTKAIQAIGSTLDIVLFQIAVALHELRSPAQAQRQIARNLTIVVAMVLPACTGLWLTLPSVEQLAIPEAYRSHFDVLLPLMMTGLFAMAVIQYGISPIFQIEKKTMPLIVAALSA